MDPDGSGVGRATLLPAGKEGSEATRARALRAPQHHESQMTQALSIARPYLMLDVESMMAKRGEDCLNLHSTLAEIAKSEWVKETKGGSAEVVPLPPLMDGLNCRAALCQAQIEFPATNVVLLQKRAEFGSAKVSLKSSGLLMNRVALATYRLSPQDDVLEKKVVLVGGALYVPIIPRRQDGFVRTLLEEVVV